VSALALIAIVAALNHYNDQPLPDWRHVSLNTLVSWLSTLAKACITLLASASLSQLKWVWFAEQKRKLSDLRTFDAASRGAFGSLELLSLQKGRQLATLGCVAVICSLAFDPFLQNTIRTAPKAVSDDLQVAYLANSSVYGTLGALMGGDGMLPLRLYA